MTAAGSNSLLNNSLTKKKSKKKSKKSKHLKKEDVVVSTPEERAEEEEEARLTEMLFGGGGLDGGSGMGAYDPLEVEEVVTSSTSDASLFQIDRAGDVGDVESSLMDLSDEVKTSSLEEFPPSVAWTDPDDLPGSTSSTVDLTQSNRLLKLRQTPNETDISLSSYQSRLRDRFSETYSSRTTEWATLPPSTGQVQGSDIQEQARSLLSSTTPLFSNRPILPPNKLEIVRCRNINQGSENKSSVSSIQFHPSFPTTNMAFTSGMDKTLRFFRVDEEKPQKLASIHLPDLPITCASFVNNGSTLVASGRRPFYYTVDLETSKVRKVPRISGRAEKSLEKFTAEREGQRVAFVGNDGYVLLVDTRTNAGIANLKLNGSVRALDFCGDQDLVASGSDGDVYRWDLRTNTCRDRFSNGDGTVTSSLSSSRNHLAVGAESGVVNLYNRDAKTPLKSFMNLRSSADLVRFHPDGEMLCVATKRERDSLKMIHVPSRTVFSNWPTSKTPFGYVSCVDFSKDGRYFGVGNDKGRCLLYRLEHYARGVDDDDEEE